tara:strand:- start:25 stop:654 length:630 start_codon:yes stop_codon:yes gene_type:complete
MLIFVILVFTAGFISGRATQKTALTEIDTFLKESELNTRSYLLEQTLLSESGSEGCPIAEERMGELSQQLGTIGRRLTEEEERQTISEDDFEYLKRTYHLHQIRFYIQAKKLAEECDSGKPLVLFFYSKPHPSSEKQGEVLDRLVEEYDIEVIAVEVGFSSDLNFIELYHEINRAPTLIVNFEDKLVGFQDYETLKSFLENTQGVQIVA